MCINNVVGGEKFILRKKGIGEEKQITIKPDFTGIKDGISIDVGPKEGSVSLEDHVDLLDGIEAQMSATSESMERKGLVYKNPNPTGQMGHRRGRKGTKKAKRFTKEMIMAETMKDTFLNNIKDTMGNIGMTLYAWPEVTANHKLPPNKFMQKDVETAMNLIIEKKHYNISQISTSIRRCIDRSDGLLSINKKKQITLDLERREEILLQQFMDRLHNWKKYKPAKEEDTTKVHTKTGKVQSEISAKKIELRRSVQQESLPSDDKQKTFKKLLSEILAFYRDAAIRSLHAIASYLLMIK